MATRRGAQKARPLLDRGSNRGTWAPPPDGSITNDEISWVAAQVGTSGGCTAFSQTFTYDEENRLTTHTEGGVTTTYTYDGQGALVAKAVGGAAPKVYIADAFEKDTAPGGGVTSYFRFGGARVAMRQGGGLSYLLADNLGSTTKTVSGSGSVTSSEKYYPFGATRSAGTVTTDKAFTGHQLEGSFYFMKARFYDPLVGRFLQPDNVTPGFSNPQALNRYSYVLNNPLRYTDPSGHCHENPSDSLCFDALDDQATSGGGAMAPIATPTPPSYQTLPCPAPGPQGPCEALVLYRGCDSFTCAFTPFLEFAIGDFCGTFTGRTLCSGGSRVTGWQRVLSGANLALTAWTLGSVKGGSLPRLLGRRGIAAAEERQLAAQWAYLRALELQAQLPAGSAGRITMAAGVLEDAGGNRFFAIASSEAGMKLRPGVTTYGGEIVVSGNGHAEWQIMN